MNLWFKPTVEDSVFVFFYFLPPFIWALRGWNVECHFNWVLKVDWCGSERSLTRSLHYWQFQIMDNTGTFPIQRFGPDLRLTSRVPPNPGAKVIPPTQIKSISDKEFLEQDGQRCAGCPLSGSGSGEGLFYSASRARTIQKYQRSKEKRFSLLLLIAPVSVPLTCTFIDQHGDVAAV